MRKIEFRAWAGKWYYSSLERWNNNGIFNYEDIDANTIGQYIGRTDRHLIGIYEDDIVKYTDGEYSFMAVVEWGDYGWYMKGRWNAGGDDNFSFEDTDATTLEVIGNIHENPELLGDKDARS